MGAPPIGKAAITCASCASSASTLARSDNTMREPLSNTSLRKSILTTAARACRLSKASSMQTNQRRNKLEPSMALLTQVITHAQHLFGSLNHLDTAFIGPLRHHQVDHFLDQSDVRRLHKSLCHCTQPVVTRLAVNRVARAFGRLVQIPAQGQQTCRVGKSRQFDTPHFACLALVPAYHHPTIGCQGDFPGIVAHMNRRLEYMTIGSGQKAILVDR